MSQNPLPRSPCIGICQLDARETCSGCNRTLSEIGRWSLASTDEKRSILAAVQTRRFQNLSQAINDATVHGLRTGTTKT